MGYRDLRDWLAALEPLGEVKTVRGASWDLEMSSISEIGFTRGKEPKPILLFDEIPGHEKGFRTLFGLLGSSRRLAMALNVLEERIDNRTLLQNWRKKFREITLVPPKLVESGPVLANTLAGDQVDLLKFPVPRFHELDGGRYLGTVHSVIIKDPDSDWVNLGTYRAMLVDRNHVAIHALESKHGSTIMARKYFARGQVMPIAIAIGVDPSLWFASCYPAVSWGVSEYDYAGGIKNEALEVFRGPYSGLPLPARAEIVIEGECHPGEVVDEGPFGEWCGYYANLGMEPVPEPLVRVKAVHYRDDPILTCAQTHVPPNETTLMRSLTSSAAIWSLLESYDTPGLRGVWCHEAGGGHMFNVISLEQLYAGAAQRVGVMASQFPKDAGGYTVLVDEDIDPFNLEEVIWAMATRVEPERSLHVIPHCRTASSDPRVPLAEKKKYDTTPKPLTASRIVVNACRPYEHKHEWYPVTRISPEQEREISEKWSEVLKDLL